MARNGKRPFHPGEVLKEDCLEPAKLGVNALAKALGVPAPRINDIRAHKWPQDRAGSSASGAASGGLNEKYIGGIVIPPALPQKNGKSGCRGNDRGVR